MKSHVNLLCSLFSLWLTALAPIAITVHLDIDATKGNETIFAISSFIENNVNRADDGGLYAELVQNRAFQEDTSYLTIPGWKKVGSASLYQDPDMPLEALKRSLEIYIPANKSHVMGERAGVSNTGWFGIPIRAQPYNASLFAKVDSGSHLTGTIDISLLSLTTNKTYAHVSFPTADLSTDWKQFTTTLHPTEDAPDSNNVLSLTMEVTADHDQHAWFNLISLFPPTYKNRMNGLRKDLAEALHDLRPKHIRIPGGSNLQGGDISSRFNWTLSLGPLEKRPGRVGYWVGYQTEGLGLKELLDMCEDFGATPILGVYDGYAADDESVPNTHQLDKYIQSAVDELHFVLGDSQTNQWGQFRAELGHPEPYKLEYVEIGNEDFTSTTYGYRWQRFYDALKAAYPNVNYIASSSIDRVNLPAVDVHDFSGPDFFYNLFDRYDNWPRNGTIIWELENGVINTNSLEPFNTPETRLPTPTLQGSIAEAVFLIGMQRNGDLVAGSSYAPYLANNYSSQWTPNLINFNITHVALSTSYYVQRMVSHARAEKTHPVTSDTPFGPLYWVASSTNDSSVFYLQIANNEQASVPVTGTIKVGASGEGDDILPRMNLTRRVNERKKLQAESTILAAGPGQAYNVTNDLDYPDAVVPVTQEITAALEGSQIVFNFTVPGWSFGVYRFALY